MSIEPVGQPHMENSAGGTEFSPNDAPVTHPDPEHAPMANKSYLKDLGGGVWLDTRSGTMVTQDSQNTSNAEPTFVQRAGSQWRMLSHYFDVGRSQASFLFKQCFGTDVESAPKKFNPQTGEFD